jgi:hypothetical protein
MTFCGRSPIAVVEPFGPAEGGRPRIDWLSAHSFPDLIWINARGGHHLYPHNAMIRSKFV